jgi:hypothetical protein
VAPVCSPIQLRQRQQRRRVGVVRGGVAQQDGLALAGQQRRGDGLGAVGGACLAAGAAPPFSLPIAVATSASICTHWPAGADDDAGERHRPVVRRRSWMRETCGALAHGGADAQREQRVVLAQVGADHQHALQRRQRRDAECPASARLRTA